MEKPRALLTDLDQGSNENWVWVRDEQQLWVAALVTNDGGATKTVRLEDGRQVTLKQSKAEPLWPFKRHGLEGQR